MSAPPTFGHFADDGRSYVITDPFAPPRAQINFLWNDHLISGINQFGTGDGIFNGRVMLVNDPRGRVQLIQDGARYCYLKDRDDGRIWNAGNQPIRHPDAELQTTVGLGWTRIDSRFAEIACSALVFLASDEPVEIWRYRIHNASDRPRRLALVPYCEWRLGGYPEFGSRYSYISTHFDAVHNAVVSTNPSDEVPHTRYNAFLATDGTVTGWAGSRRQFLGVYGHAVSPEALVGTGFPSQPTCNEDLAGALEIALELAPGETREVCVALGAFDAEHGHAEVVEHCLDPAERDRTWQALAAAKEDMIAATSVSTPDPRLDLLTNIWSKQQTQLCAEFGRDGARGFRDTLQDAWGMAPFQAALARDKLLETLRHQRADGSGIRGWLPLQEHRYSDGPVWLVLAVDGYLRETGDVQLLDELCPYLDGPAETVFAHLLKAMRHLSDDCGAHGLVRAHAGDWNDSLNWLGRGGEGESVWTSIGLYHALQVLLHLIAELRDDAELIAEMRERRDRIEHAVQTAGWDGEWYLAGYSDRGSKVGSRDNDEGQCYLNPQTWAIMAGLATGERRAACLRAIDERLESDHGSLTLAPPYTRRDDDVGRVTMMLPGMYENGTPYCHGTAFKIVADCCAGRGDHALRSWHKVMPDNPEHPSLASGAEPYAFTNQYLGPNNLRAGTSLTGWISGTAGWMYRSVHEYLIGVQPDHHGFVVRPCLPRDWDRVTVTRRLRGRERTIEVTSDGDGYRVKVDGAAIEVGALVAY